MSFVSDTVLSGSARLHIARGGGAGKDGAKQNSQTPGGLFSPLIQLVKDPLGTITGRDSEDARACKHEADHKQLLYLRMQDAETYEDWKAAATELDTVEGNDGWKREDESSDYDAALVKARLEQLDDARTNCDVKRMLFLVRTSLTRGLGGMGDLRLYKHSHVGTKKLIDRYIDSAIQTLAALPEVAAKQGDASPVKLHVVLEELLRTRQSFGRTALLLSGGGTFGMNHIGVVKCLWDLRLLPRIVSGASAGSIVCSVLCSKTDDEIPAVLHEFCYGDLAVFEKEGEAEGVMEKVARFLKYGSLYDISHLERVMRKMLGDVTFQESYNRTRRILNITVSSASVYELPRLLNYVTAPDVMIWSAVCASCSVPLVFSAASLMAKDRKTGQEIPWDPTPNEGWIDGSVDNDLPMTRLAEMFNVNHFIVSQVNPHVVPFLAKEEAAIGAEVQQTSAFSAGPGWMHNLASFAKGEALHRLDVLAEMGVFPNAVTKARSVLNQRYSGDITIFPAISYTNFPKILSNPTTDYMLRCMLTGEQATWPKVSRIQNHVAVELALDEAVNQILPHVHFSTSQANLRLLNFSRPASQDGRLPSKNRMRRKHKSTHFENHTALPTPSVEITSPTFSHQLSPRIIRMPPPSVDRPYLPTHPTRRGARSLDIKPTSFSNVDAISSTEHEGGSSSDDELSGNEESDTTDLLSSSSPPYSPPTRARELWPSVHQNSIPPLSNPSTPSQPAMTFGHRSKPSLNFKSTSSATPSSPESRYKRLFHPRAPTPPPGSPRLNSTIQQEVRRTLQPLTTLPSLQQIETLPEHQKAPPSGLLRTDSLDESNMRAFDTPTFSPGLSPVSVRDCAKANEKRKLSPQQQSEVNEAERAWRESRRGSVQGLGLAFDYSGTKGMVLRKKQSRSGGPTDT